MRYRKSILISLLIIINLLLSACWSYTEIDERLIVGSVGIDYGEYKDTYKLTIRAVSAKPSVSGVEIVPEVISMEGKTVFDVIRKAAPIYGTKLYWSHLQSIVISEELAQSNVLTTLDFFYRDAEIRPDSRVYIASGATAEQIIRTEALNQEKTQFALSQAIKTQEFVGSFPDVDLVEFQRRVLDETTESTAPIVSIYIDLEGMLRVEGTAMFIGPRLVGKLNREESLVVLLIGNDVKNPIMTIPINSKEVSNVIRNQTLEIFRSKSNIKSSIKDDKVKILVDIQLDVGMAEANYSMNYLNERDIKELKSVSEDEIRKMFIRTINKIQEYKTDVFGFGIAVEMEDPKLWKKIKEQWSENFSNLPVDVKVTVNIIGTGKTTTSLEGDK